MNKHQNNVAYLKTDIEDAKVVWFKHSGEFVLLEKPAYDVLHMYSKGIDVLKIVGYCQEKYSEQEEHIAQFVNEIIKNIDKLNEKKSPHALVKSKTFSNTNDSKLFSENQYLFGESYITIRYDNDYLQDLIHPLFFHLETKNSEKPAFLFELVSNNNTLIFKNNNKIIETFHLKDVIYFKGAILKYLYGLLHEKGANSWMMTLHASGVVIKNEAVLFSASAGSGKSTLAALLQAHGYQLLSDDFIAADENACVYSFPSAISVKDGSVDVLSKYYPELKNNQFEKSFIRNQIRFIPNRNFVKKTESGFKVKAIVFLKYTPNDNSSLNEMNKKEAIQLLLKEIWVNPKPKNISRFLEWLNQTTFYQMRYSDTSIALEYMSKIFER